MNSFLACILILAAAVAGIVMGCFFQRSMGKRRVGDANDLARRIVEEARKEAQAQKKEIL
ncbi:MAG: DUF3552 domain-containing protein, partial [Mailhella sp.]|nr:DUF3552 domain-containing protein [Mailhella sp.]